MNLRSSLRTLAFASVCALPLPAGVLTFNFTETGGNVVVTASGSLTDSTAWVSSGGPSTVFSIINPSAGVIAFTGTGSNVEYSAQGTLSGNWALSFGTGGEAPATLTSGGDILAFVRDPSLNPSSYVAPHVVLPSGYSFSTSTPQLLSSTMTFTGASFTTLGITTGSYVFNNGTDTIQLTFGGGGGSSVPDAGPGPALALLLGGLGLRQWRSSRSARTAA